MKNVIAQGYDFVSTTHVVLEIRRLVDQGGGTNGDHGFEWVRPEWVGRRLHALGALGGEPDNFRRMRVHGSNLRFYQINPSYLAGVKEEFERRNVEIKVGTKHPTDFCGDCGSCPYSTHGCEIMAKRQKTNGLSHSLVINRR
ncbi:MAG TPA: hypothetical protein VGC66_09585 [Pyrinomonadaceae bacterium]